jgi:hypothetical protein
MRLLAFLVLVVDLSRSEIRPPATATDLTPPLATPLFPGLAVSFSVGPDKWNNVSYSLDAFATSGGASDGPWTLINSDIHAVITKTTAGRFKLAFTPKKHTVPRVSFPFLAGGTTF